MSGGAAARAISSIKIVCSISDAPRPPYSSGPGNAYPAGFMHLLLPRSEVLKAVLGIVETRSVPIRGDVCLEPGSELITKALLRRREI